MRRVLTVGLAAALAVLAVGTSAQAAPTTIRVSVSSSGAQANDISGNVSISRDGRLVAFTSAATNLVPGDTNGAMDIFVRDTVTGTTIRADVTSSGAQANGLAEYPVISGDGRYVAFYSEAPNLAPRDPSGGCGGLGYVFVRDLVAHTTTRVTTMCTVTVPVSMSSDGRYLLLDTYTQECTDVASRWDRVTGTTRRVLHSVEYGFCPWGPILSADGRFLMYTLVTSRNPDVPQHVYVKDLVRNRTWLVWGSAGGYATALSAHGRHRMFTSTATGVVVGDTNHARDVFVRDSATGKTTRVSLSSSGAQANGASWGIGMSRDGRYYLFQSSATNLVPGDTNGQADLFVRDIIAKTTRRVDLSSTGAQSNGRDFPYMAAIALWGDFVAFDSSATNLVPGDTNNTYDIFLRGPLH